MKSIDSYSGSYEWPHHTSYLSFFTQAKFLENKIYTEKRVNYNGFCDKIA